MGRSAQCLINQFQKLLTSSDVVERMLGIATFEVAPVGQDVPVVRLNEGIGIGKRWIGDLCQKGLQIDEASIESAGHHAAEAEDLRQRIAFDDRPWQSLAIEVVIDGSVGKAISL